MLRKKIFLFLKFIISLAVIGLIIIWFGFNPRLKAVKLMATRETNGNPDPESVALSFDDYCDKYGEWETIDDHVFFKKSAVFYFVDMDLLRIHLLRHGSMRHEFIIFVTLLQSDGTNFTTLPTFGLYSKDLELKFVHSSSKYFYSVIDARLDAMKHQLKIVDLTKTRILLIVKDLVSDSQTNNYLNVKIKRFYGGEENKKGSLVCSKCFYLNSDSERVALKWWIELNKMSGHDNVFMCDHAIPDSNQLAQEYADFVIMDKLKCIPNIQSNANYTRYKYLKRHTMLEYGTTGQFDVTKYEVIMRLVQNECYLNYRDKYKLIAAYDNDEVLLSKWNSGFLTLKEMRTYVQNINKVDSLKKEFDEAKCDRRQSDRSFEAYFNEITPLGQIFRPNAYFFNHGNYIPYRLAKQVFDKLDKVAESKPSKPYNISISITDDQKSKGPKTLNLTIESQNDFIYAMNLLKIYHEIIKPTLIDSDNHIFDRVFALIGDMNNYALGKTVHDTNFTFDFSIHFMETYYANLTLIQDPHFRRYSYLPYNVAHLSHFRKELNFPYNTAPFSSFYLDLNYFLCYYKPIIKKTTGWRSFF